MLIYVDRKYISKQTCQVQIVMSKYTDCVDLFLMNWWTQVSHTHV